MIVLQNVSSVTHFVQIRFLYGDLTSECLLVTPRYIEIYSGMSPSLALAEWCFLRPNNFFVQGMKLHSDRSVYGIAVINLQFVQQSMNV